MADALDRMASTQGQGQDALDRMAATIQPSAQPHPLSRLGSAFWDGVGGKALTEIMAGASRDPERAKKAMETAKGLVRGLANEPSRVWQELSESGSAMAHGDVTGAVSHLGKSAPLVGAAAGQVQSDFENGDYASGFGHAMALLLPFAAPEMAAKSGVANAAMGRAASRIAASKLPEAIGTEVKNSLTPGIVRRIRERLNPAPSNTPAVATVDAPAGFDIAPPASTGSGMSPSARPSSGVIPPVAGSLPSRPLTAPGVASMGDAQKLAAWMKSGSLSQPEAALMDAGDWKLAAQGAGVAEPSAATIKAAMDQLPAAKSATQIKVRRSK